MKKQALFSLIFILIIVIFMLIFFFSITLRKKTTPIDNTKFILENDNTIEVYSTTYISSKITSLEGKLLENPLINTNVLGSQNITFLYEDNKGKKKKGTIKVEVVDTTEPFILLGNSYTVPVGYTGKLEDVIFSADNYDQMPKREIIGEYDMNIVGSYPLIYKVTDQSGNVESVSFTLHVKEKVNNSSIQPSYINFSDVVKNYKNASTKIGVDISKWQGDIDYERLKNAGVEFVIIRVGTGLGFQEPSIEDPYFRQNIERAKKVGMQVGIYYYSYATTIEEAKEQAHWVMDIIGEYEIHLPVVFDWESWSYFNTLNLSIHDLNKIADTFLTEIEKGGYTPMLYGSKYLLQYIWDTTSPVWLAHYTTSLDYEGSYKMWQLCENGLVDGIDGTVDIDILYE